MTIKPVESKIHRTISQWVLRPWFLRIQSPSHLNAKKLVAIRQIQNIPNVAWIWALIKKEIKFLTKDHLYCVDRNFLIRRFSYFLCLLIPPLFQILGTMWIQNSFFLFFWRKNIYSPYVFWAKFCKNKDDHRP